MLDFFNKQYDKHITDHLLVDKLKVTTLRNVTDLLPSFNTIRSKYLKLFDRIRRSNAKLT